MKVILDTNVLVSAALCDRNPEKVILWIVQQADVEWIATPEILREYRQVLARPRLGLLAADRDEWLSVLQASLTLIDMPPELDFPRDQKDAKFLACALASHADYLITGDGDFDEAPKLIATAIVSVSRFKQQFVGQA